MLNIVLSRAVRNDVNRLVREHPDFEVFRVASGAFDSRDMTKDILMRAIEYLGLEDSGARDGSECRTGFAYSR